MLTRILLLAALLVACWSCASNSFAPEWKSSESASNGPQTHSLQGEALYPPPSGEQEAQRLAALDAALERLAREPNDPDAWVWLGRRLAYLGRYREAIRVFGQGLGRFPDDARLLRHRGHRWITLRQFAVAEADLARAARSVKGQSDEPEPGAGDGPVLDTLQQNVFYHLALARFLQGDEARSLEAWYECLGRSNNADAQCSARAWIAGTLFRLGRSDEALKILEPITRDLAVLEYHAYHDLCLVLKGELDAELALAHTPIEKNQGVDFATLGFGVANWWWCQGQRERALALFERVAHTPMWPAFGRIASEVELVRHARPSR